VSAAVFFAAVLIVSQFVGMHSFLAPPAADRQSSASDRKYIVQRGRYSMHGPKLSSLFMAADPDFNSNDPFVILGLDPSPNLDKKVVKRAYKKLALKYHPDVAEDNDKKRASDRFAKINWAYETLSGKNQEAAKTGTSSSASSSGWTPPHRRKATTTSSSGGSSTGFGSTDWRDYIPNYPDENYDSGGDSFEAIFSDLFKGAAMGGGSVFRDFVEFLEQNVEGYSGGADDDAQLRVLLQTGTVNEIGDEMDDTEMVVKQLSSKLKSIEDELIMVQADLKLSTRYTEKIDLEEREAELQARKDVVNGYLKKARKRLISLQTRYKQLIVDGDNDRRAGGGSASRTSSYDPARDSYSSTGHGSPASSSRSSYSSTGSTASTSPSRPSDSTAKGDAWKDESFGSFGRGRGSSRRRSSQRKRSTSGSSTGSTSRASSGSAYASDKSSYRATSDSPSSRRTADDSGRRSSSSFFSEQTHPASSQIPPHRRSSFAQEQDDKRRLRELKVDDEFEKLKKDLGL